MTAYAFKRDAIIAGSIADARDSAQAWKRLALEAIARVSELERREKHQAERIGQLLRDSANADEAATDEALDQADGWARVTSMLETYAQSGDDLLA